MRLLHAMIGLLALALAGTATGQRHGLRVGDGPPGLSIESWIGGDEVTIGPDQAYVIMFWERMGESDSQARAYARLKDLANRYGPRGLVCVAVSDDDAQRLVQFAQAQGSGVKGLTLAVDRRNTTRRAWLSRLDDEPEVFIVGKGKILFIGMLSDDEFEPVLKKVLGGRYDPVLAARAEPVLKAARRARDFKNYRMAVKHYDEIVALDSMVFADVALERFEMMLVDMEEPREAYGYAKDTLIAERFANDAGALRMLATKISSDPKIPRDQRDFDIALAAVERALELDGSHDSGALAAVALVHFHKGDIDKAVEVQTRAYFAARPQDKAEQKRVLRRYQGAASRSTPIGSGG